MDTLLNTLRNNYLGCDIEVNIYDDASGIPSVTSKGPIEAIDRGPDQAIVVTVKWFGEKVFAPGTPAEYVAREPVPIVLRVNENIRIDDLGRIILIREVNGKQEIVVFFSKSRGNMDPRKVRGIDPKFLPT